MKSEEYFAVEYGLMHIKDVVNLKDLKSLYGLIEEYKEYRVKAKLEEAAERAECKKEYYPNGVDYYYITEVDKQSITETPLD